MKPDKYLKIVTWLRKRYTKNGMLVIEKGGSPSKYTRLETLAWLKYMVAGARWLEMDTGIQALFYITASGIAVSVEDFAWKL